MAGSVVVLGGDGFCGWPTSLRLASEGYRVVIVDNLSRRRIDKELSTDSLVPIAPIEARVEAAIEHLGDVSFVNIDLAADVASLRALLEREHPIAVVHFAEQRSAPYSMIDDESRRYTVDNNTAATHNLLSAIVDIDRSIHLVHLGTMGVYGYSKEFGAIPEGYLDICINQTGIDTSVLYPANPGSVYHMTKCLDQLLFQFYNKNWGLRVTDLHQGIVWGAQTELTAVAPELANRFDYDGVYGTVLNRFIVQAANGHPLTVYGTGGQTRAFIHIRDTARCVELAIANPPDEDSERVRIFNQVAETASVMGLAKKVAKLYDAEVGTVPNPRKELAENELEVSNAGLVSLGFEPTRLDDGLVDDVNAIAKANGTRFSSDVVLNSPKW